jgi:ABC-2 type transport system ATP-binding protein
VLPAVELENLSHSYGSKRALENVSLRVSPGEIFGLLGPNGGGKSTAFKILNTSMVASGGVAKILGYDLRTQSRQIRPHLGVVFQFPALDKKLKVVENLSAHGCLYGVTGPTLKDRIQFVLARLSLQGYEFNRVETLSGGLQRRVEIAKAMLHDPEIFILDEPTAGLDPRARRDVWEHLKFLKNTHGKTILMTTHLLEEAEKCDRIGILHQGKLVALASPESLKTQMGDSVITVKTPEGNSLAQNIEKKFGGACDVYEGEVRWHIKDGHTLVAPLIESFGSSFESIHWAKPTLEDFFIQKTGAPLSEGMLQ